MKVKKRLFTLLETLLALGLTTILLGMTTFLFRQVDVANRSFEKLQEEGFKMRYVNSRLLTILPQALMIKPTQKEAFFFTSSSIDSRLFGSAQSLVFTYDNGIKLDAHFSNHVLGRLYVDDERRLCLLTWPSPLRWSHIGLHSLVPKKEILLDEVDDLTFSFFVGPDRPWERKKPLKPNPTKQSSTHKEPVAKPAEGWNDRWERYQELPALIKIRFRYRNKPKTFVLPFPNSNRQIVYNK
jgi:hypothetical protein